jgi:hypothetical protein
LLESVLETPQLADRLLALLRPEMNGSGSTSHVSEARPFDRLRAGSAPRFVTTKKGAKR